MVVLNIAKAAVFAHSRCLQIKADVLNWMAKGRVFIPFTCSNSPFNLDRWHLIDQFHWRFLACVLHPFGGVASNDGRSADCLPRGEAPRRASVAGAG